MAFRQCFFKTTWTDQNSSTKSSTKFQISPVSLTFSPKGPPSFFFVFCDRLGIEKSQRFPPFNFFRRCETFFKKIFSAVEEKTLKLWCPFAFFSLALDMAPTWDGPGMFVIKLNFLSTVYPNFVFFLLKRRFSVRLFSKLFSSKPPPRFLLETKRFARMKDYFEFKAICELPETFFRFLRGFRLSKTVFPV